MTIEYWSDYACPFCYIGIERLKKILAKLGVNDVSITFRSFELNPNAPEIPTQTMQEYGLSQGMSIPQGLMYVQYLKHSAKSEGIDMNILQVKLSSTFRAHCLTQYAQKNKDKITCDQLITRLYKSYFTYGENIADRAVLEKIAEEIGMTNQDVDLALNERLYGDMVRSDELIAHQNGITGAPYFLLNGKYSLSGAQPDEVMEAIVKKVLAEEPPYEKDFGFCCGPDGCH